MDQLACDVAAALAARMSYGKYMAQKYKPGVPKELELPDVVVDANGHNRPRKVCKICGKDFYAMVYNQLCCSQECREENHRIGTREYQRRKAAKRKEHGKRNL